MNKSVSPSFKAYEDDEILSAISLFSQAGLAVPEPQRNVNGELVIFLKTFHLQGLCQASLETGLDESDASIANIVRLLKFIPGKTFYEIGHQHCLSSPLSLLFWTSPALSTLSITTIMIKTTRNMDDGPFCAMRRVHREDGQLTGVFHTHGLQEQVHVIQQNERGVSRSIA